VSTFTAIIFFEDSLSPSFKNFCEERNVVMIKIYCIQYKRLYLWSHTCRIFLCIIIYCKIFRTI